MQPIQGTSDITGPERPQQGAFRGTSLIGPRFYLPATILIIVIAFIGFWPSYFGPALKGRVHVPPLIHLHAVIYVTWLALFATQVALAATNRVKLHMQLGRWIMAYGVVVVIAGLMALAQAFGKRLATEDVFRAQRYLFGVLKDLVFLRAVLSRWLDLSPKARNSQATDDRSYHHLSVTSSQPNVVSGHASSDLEIHAGVANACVPVDDS